MTNRELFKTCLAGTSPSPLALEIADAHGNYLIGADGKRYLDLIGGISVCNIGHKNPRVVEAIKQQAEQYLHIMVYGELIQSPQVRFAELITKHLPSSLNTVYFTNSGAEATEGAIKLARRYTGRPGIIACNKAYHGNTTGALALMGDEYWRNAFRPLMPGVWHYDYNSQSLIDAINDDTACVVLESVQGEAGVIVPETEWIRRVSAACRKKGALLILDEIQTGFGRTGSLWAFEQLGLVPDILLLGKALGGGMPLGSFIANKTVMDALTHDPVLGHITTFGGHPVSCAAGMAAMNVLLTEKLAEKVQEKEKLFTELLKHNAIRSVRTAGLLIAVQMKDSNTVELLIKGCLDEGLFSDWFLFAPNCLRIAPPLTISLDEIKHACGLIRKVLDRLSN